MKFKKLLTVRWTPPRLLFVAAACTYLSLAVLPASRWLVRGQSTPGVAQRKAADHWQEQNFVVAAKHPDDFEMQLAAALQSPPGSVRGKQDLVGRLWDLQARFPNEPALYAGILRYSTGDTIKTGRAEEQELLFSPDVRAKSALDRAKHPETPIDPKAAKRFLAASETGERLDPQNGYFPMMQAIALFATNQDATALAALHRAALKPTWNDYASAEVLAGNKLNDAAHGETGTLAKSSRQAAVLFPHFAQLRGMARVTMALAVRRELAGDTEGGWEIRRDLARCGAIMRSKAPSFIGSLVGSAIGQLAMARPGGEETPKEVIKVSSEERVRLRFQRFLAYADKIGHSKDAAFFIAQKTAADESKKIWNNAARQSLFGMERLSQIVSLWAVGSSLVSNTLIVLLLGGIAFGLARTPRIRAGQKLHPAVRWGLGAFVAPFPGALIGSLYAGSEGAVLGAALGLFLEAATAIVLLMRGTERWRNLAIFAATIPAICGLLGIIALSATSAVQIFQSFSSFIGMMSFDPTSGLLGSTLQIAAVGIVMVLPLLWILGLATWARVRRVPVSVGIVRGAAGSALVMASLLLFAYAGTTLFTLRVEARGLHELTQMVQHEGRYYAGIAGKSWPGVEGVRQRVFPSTSGIGTGSF